jgi:formylglycine-generating enzyme required for sulfatase activity
MASGNALSQLKADQIIGPDHRRFQLTELSGETALGSLWKAKDILSNNAEVSLFIVSPEIATQKPFQEALKKQVIQARKLDHPHIIKLIGSFIQKPNLLMIASEPVDGLSLEQLIRKKQSSKLSRSQQKGLLVQTAKAIEHFHSKTRLPIISLSPDVVFINKKGGVKLFPLSLHLLLNEVDSHLVEGATYKAYLSPEAFHPNLIPESTDIFSLALLSYAMFHGRSAFTSNTPDSERLNPKLKWPSFINDDGKALLTKAVSEDPDARPEQAVPFIEHLFDSVDESKEDHSESSDSEPAKEPSQTTQKSASGTSSKPKWALKVTELAKLKPALWYAAGFGTAFVLLGSVMGYQQMTLNQQVAGWKDKALELKEALDTQQLAMEALEAQMDTIKAEQQASEAVEPREAAPIENNFIQFQDPLAAGGYGPVMISIPAGRFTMGDQHKQGDDNERPIIEVNITEPFALAQFEVTFDQYDLFAKATGRPLPDDGGFGRGQQPVINVSWNDARDYTAWLAQQTKQPYRLPSESEWEYAARAGTSTAYWWGDELSPLQAVCDECGTQWDGEKPAPIGQMPLNPWGLADMNGNVDEWVQDCYQETYEQYPKNGDPSNALNCEYRSMRGGSWFDIARVIRSASRYRHPPDASRNSWGFRVALDLAQ